MAVRASPEGNQDHDHSNPAQARHRRRRPPLAGRAHLRGVRRRRRLGGAVRARPRRRPEQADGRRDELGRLHAARHRREGREGDRGEGRDHRARHQRGHGREGGRLRGRGPRRRLRLAALPAGVRRGGPAGAARHRLPGELGLARPRGPGPRRGRRPAVLRAVHVGHHRHLLPLRPRRRGTHQLVRPAAAGGAVPRQDHDDGHRALGRDARAEGTRLLGQHHRRGRDGGRQGADARGQAPPPRLRRHHVLRAPDQRRGRDGGGLGRLVQLRHRARTPTSTSSCPRRARTCGSTASPS